MVLYQMNFRMNVLRRQSPLPVQVDSCKGASVVSANIAISIEAWKKLNHIDLEKRLSSFRRKKELNHSIIDKV